MTIQHDDALRRRDERRRELAPAVALVAPEVAPAGERVGLGQRREVAGGRVAQHDERGVRPAGFERGNRGLKNLGGRARGVKQDGVYRGCQQGGQKRLGARGGLPAQLQGFLLAQKSGQTGALGGGLGDDQGSCSLHSRLYPFACPSVPAGIQPVFGERDGVNDDTLPAHTLHDLLAYRKAAIAVTANLPRAGR